MAEKMRYENEIENAKVDDEFNNSEEDLSAEQKKQVIQWMKEDICGRLSINDKGNWHRR